MMGQTSRFSLFVFSFNKLESLNRKDFGNIVLSFFSAYQKMAQFSQNPLSRMIASIKLSSMSFLFFRGCRTFHVDEVLETKRFKFRSIAVTFRTLYMKSSNLLVSIKTNARCNFHSSQVVDHFFLTLFSVIFV